MKSFIYRLLVFTIIFYSSSYAQNTNHIIKGNIFDSKSDKGIEFANIALYKSKDSSILTGSATGKNGEFIIPNVPTGKYYMKINFVGYKTRIVPTISISAAQKEFAIGKIVMEESAILMSETEVVGKKQSVEYRLDKKIFNISQDISSIGGSALDAMKNQPSVQTNAEGNILIRGSEGFTVLIDGKPSLLQGSDALKTIPANMIESIELITNPSARHDAEGVSGIVNIITKKNTESTLSYVANAGRGTGERYNGDFYISHRNNKYTLNAEIDYRHENEKGDREYHKTSFDSTDKTDQHGIINNDRPLEIYNFRLGADYIFNNNSNIFFNALCGYNKYLTNYLFKYHQYSSHTDNFSITKDDRDKTDKLFSTSVIFSHKFAPKISELITELFYGYIKNSSSENISEFNSNDNYSDYNDFQSGKYFNETNGIKRIRFKADYKHNFTQTRKFESGLQADLLNKSRELSLKTINFENDLSGLIIGETNKIKFTSNVYSAYILYSDKLFNLDYQIGLRAEATDRIFELKTLETKYDYDELHIFPSCHISKSFGIHNFLLSYSARIRRPSEWMLDPYVITSDSYIVYYGNPNLMIETIDSYEFSYLISINDISLSMETYLRNSSNKVFEYFTTDDKQRLSSHLDNFKKVVESGCIISADFPITDIFKLSPSINLYNVNYDGMINERNISRNDFTYNSKMILRLNLCKNTQLQFNIFYNGERTDIDDIDDPYWNYSGSIRQLLFDNKVVLSLQAKNLFNAKYSSHQQGHNFTFDRNGNLESNILSLFLSYNFNDFKKPKSISNESIDD